MVGSAPVDARSMIAPAVGRAVAVLLVILAGLGCGSNPTDPSRFPGTRVLFIGNSLTSANNLVLIVRAIAAAGGFEISGGQVVFGNHSLRDHLDRGSAVAGIRDLDWDYVVLQQGPSGQPDSRVELIASARQFEPFIEEQGAVPALYMVWPDASRMTAFDSVSVSYTAAADAVGGLLFPAGDAWTRAWQIDPTLALYSGDNFHPSPLGSYLAALTIYAVLCNQSPTSLPLRPAGLDKSVLREASDADIRVLQQAAQEVTALLPRKGTCAPLAD